MAPWRGLPIGGFAGTADREQALVYTIGKILWYRQADRP